MQFAILYKLLKCFPILKFHSNFGLKPNEFGKEKFNLLFALKQWQIKRSYNFFHLTQAQNGYNYPSPQNPLSSDAVDRQAASGIKGGSVQRPYDSQTGQQSSLEYPISSGTGSQGINDNFIPGFGLSTPSGFTSPSSKPTLPYSGGRLQPSGFVAPGSKSSSSSGANDQFTSSGPGLVGQSGSRDIPSGQGTFDQIDSSQRFGTPDAAREGQQGQGTRFGGQGSPSVASGSGIGNSLGNVQPEKGTGSSSALSSATGNFGGPGTSNTFGGPSAGSNSGGFSETTQEGRPGFGTSTGPGISNSFSGESKDYEGQRPIGTGTGISDNYGNRPTTGSNERPATFGGSVDANGQPLSVLSGFGLTTPGDASNNYSGSRPSASGNLGTQGIPNTFGASGPANGESALSGSGNYGSAPGSNRVGTDTELSTPQYNAFGRPSSNAFGESAGTPSSSTSIGSQGNQNSQGLFNPSTSDNAFDGQREQNAPGSSVNGQQRPGFGGQQTTLGDVNRGVSDQGLGSTNVFNEQQPAGAGGVFGSQKPIGQTSGFAGANDRFGLQAATGAPGVFGSQFPSSTAGGISGQETTSSDGGLNEIGASGPDSGFGRPGQTDRFDGQKPIGGFGSQNSVSPSGEILSQRPSNQLDNEGPNSSTSRFGGKSPSEIFDNQGDNSAGNRFGVPSVSGFGNQGPSGSASGFGPTAGTQDTGNGFGVQGPSADGVFARPEGFGGQALPSGSGRGFGGQATPSGSGISFGGQVVPSGLGGGLGGQSGSGFGGQAAPSGSGSSSGGQVAPSGLGGGFGGQGSQGASGPSGGITDQESIGGIGGQGLSGPLSSFGLPTGFDSGQYNPAFDGSYPGGDYSAIPGNPGVDYPIYANLPETSFDCLQQQWPGYYADVEAQCQVFHICALNKTFSFLCPNGTIFSQEHLVCVWWNQFDCSTAPSLYGNNAFIYDYSQTGQKYNQDQSSANNYPENGQTGVSGPSSGFPVIQPPGAFADYPGSAPGFDGSSNSIRTSGNLPSSADSTTGFGTPILPNSGSVGSTANYPGFQSKTNGQRPSTSPGYTNGQDITDSKNNFQGNVGTPIESGQNYPGSSAKQQGSGLNANLPVTSVGSYSGTPEREAGDSYSGPQNTAGSYPGTSASQDNSFPGTQQSPGSAFSRGPSSRPNLALPGTVGGNVGSSYPGTNGAQSQSSLFPGSTGTQATGSSYPGTSGAQGPSSSFPGSTGTQTPGTSFPGSTGTQKTGSSYPGTSGSQGPSSSFPAASGSSYPGTSGAQSSSSSFPGSTGTQKPGTSYTGTTGGQGPTLSGSAGAQGSSYPGSSGAQAPGSSYQGGSSTQGSSLSQPNKSGSQRPGIDGSQETRPSYQQPTGSQGTGLSYPGALFSSGNNAQSPSSTYPGIGGAPESSNSYQNSDGVQGLSLSYPGGSRTPESSLSNNGINAAQRPGYAGDSQRPGANGIGLNTPGGQAQSPSYQGSNAGELPNTNLDARPGSTYSGSRGPQGTASSSYPGSAAPQGNAFQRPSSSTGSQDNKRLGDLQRGNSYPESAGAQRPSLQNNIDGSSRYPNGQSPTGTSLSSSSQPGQQNGIGSSSGYPTSQRPGYPGSSSSPDREYLPAKRS